MVDSGRNSVPDVARGAEGVGGGDVAAIKLLLWAEIDHCHWALSQMLSQEQRLSALDRMIDDVTGFDKEKLAAAKRLMRRVRWLKKKLAALEAK